MTSCFVGDLVGDWDTKVSSPGPPQQKHNLTDPGYAGWTGCSWHWARTGSIQAHSLSQRRIGNRGRPSCSSRGDGTRSRGSADRGGCLRSGGRRLEDGDCCRPDKHAPAGRAVEVSLALDSAVILARVVIELDADPVAHGEMGLADEADDSITAVAQPNVLSNCYLGHVVLPFGLAMLIS